MRLHVFLMMMLITLCGVSLSHAADHDLFLNPREARIVMFADASYGRSFFGSWGFKQSLRGTLDRSGPVMMATLGYGGEGETIEGALGRSSLLRYASKASALYGYQWMLGKVIFTGLVGPEMDAEQAVENGAIQRISEPRWGARLQWEMWAHPTPDTLATLTVIGGTARGHVWSRASAGYKIMDNAFIGPEVTGYMTETYREWRVGAHLTGLTLGRAHVTFSSGWRRDDDKRSGFYGGLTTFMKL
jgi:hypothetical protein